MRIYKALRRFDTRLPFYPWLYRIVKNTCLNHVTSSTVHGKTIVRPHGLVRGNTVRASHIGKDIQALFRNIVGGEVNEYIKMLTEAREQSIDRMISEPQKLGANALVDVRFGLANVVKGTTELLAYGTAVTVEDGPDTNAAL